MRKKTKILNFRKLQRNRCEALLSWGWGQPQGGFALPRVALAEYVQCLLMSTFTFKVCTFILNFLVSFFLQILFHHLFHFHRLLICPPMMILKCYFLQLRQAEFTNGWGTSRVILCWYSPVKYKNHQHSHQQQQHHYHFQALSRISNVEFRVSSGGSVALCSLAFDTNLRKIDFAEVTKILVWLLFCNFWRCFVNKCLYFFLFFVR